MKKPENIYYICHIENLASILKKGIYCRAQVNEEKLPHHDIHDQDVLDRRNKNIITGKNLHDYVNLYFQPRNAMLYRLICNEKKDNFVILSINSSVLDKKGVYISNRNAAASQAEFSLC